jgi:predicted Zn-dependent protease
VRSNGCASAASALFITTQHAPNLRLVPGAEDVTFDDMVRDTKRGVAIMSLNPLMDHQQLNGMSTGMMREIRDGKLGRYLQFGGVLFRSPELWRNLVAIGGPRTEAWFGFARRRGQPDQTSMHSVGAVPAKIANISVIDTTRKA